MVQGDEGLLFLIAACRKQSSVIPVGIDLSWNIKLPYLSPSKQFYTQKQKQNKTKPKKHLKETNVVNMNSIHAYIIITEFFEALPKCSNNLFKESILKRCIDKVLPLKNQWSWNSGICLIPAVLCVFHLSSWP